MERTVVYQITPEHLDEFLSKKIARMERKEKDTDPLSIHKKTFVGVKTVADILKISPATVRTYINDRLIEPEVRNVENGNYRFPLSYVLTLDKTKLKDKVKERKYK